MLYFFVNDKLAKGSTVFKKLFLIVLYIISGQAIDIPSSCAKLLNKSIDHICYIGSIDLNLKQKEQLSLYYDGNIIKVNNGVYCFKEHRDVKKFYFLFINPEAICFRTNRHETDSYLTFNDITPYEFYRIKAIESVDLEEESFIDWNIKQKPMKKVQKDDALRVVIPEHTIIIPLTADYFDHQDERIIFNYKPLKNKHAVVKLPTPQYAQSTDREKLIESLLQANLCIMNLKNIHAPQEIKKIRLDNHTLIQETS